MKAPTAEQSLKSHANTEFMWGYHDVIRAIESHTQAHTEGLKAVLREVDEYLSSNPKNYVGSGSILHQKIQEALK